MPPLNDQPQPAALAAAAWKDVSAKLYAYQAALLRGDETTAQAIRQEAHDMLDTCLDLNGTVARAALAILDR